MHYELHTQSFTRKNQMLAILLSSHQITYLDKDQVPRRWQLIDQPLQASRDETTLY